MDVQTIKTAPDLVLKPNRYFEDVQIPFLYQRRGILMMLIRRRMILGDDVGLGKTLEAIVAFSYMKARNPKLKALVLTEKIAYLQWLKEFEWLTPTLRVKLITPHTHQSPILRTRAYRQHGADVVITSYSAVTPRKRRGGQGEYRYGDHIREGLGPEWVLIADEPNYFKNPRSKLHRAIFNMTNDPRTGAQRAYGLTATVLENRLEEVFGISRVVTPGIFASRAQFERDYCVIRKLPGIPARIVVGYKNLDRFRQQLEPAYYGRLQDDPEVMQALPDVISKDVEIEMEPEQSRKVLEAMDRIIQMPGGEVKQVDILPSLILAQQLANDPRLLGFKIPGAKVDALMEILTGSLSGERVVVFSKLRSMVDLLEVEINKAGMKTVRITGAEDQGEREESKRRFMTDGKDRCNVLLMTRAGQKAVNLQKGGHLFFFDLPWSYGLYRQTVGRLKRTGSSFKAVGVYRMLACLHPNTARLAGSVKTIDHHALAVVMRKFKLWQALTGDITEIESATSDMMEIYREIRKAGA